MPTISGDGTLKIMAKKHLVSVIIRSHNEEKWLRHSIQSVLNQSVKDLEIILVDNKSTDRSVEIAKKMGVKKIYNIDEYNPGQAINLGIGNSSAKYIAILSAHCIPFNSCWLQEMINCLEENPKIAGAYSRQVPLPFSNPSDSRDLFITFSTESRTQKSDSFFHNGSSLIRFNRWQKIPFNEEISNIEDRIWAHQQQTSGYLIHYCSTSIVFHHHGIHQNIENTSRSKTTVDIIRKKFHPYGSILPETMLPEEQHILCIISIKDINEKTNLQNFQKIYSQLVKTKLKIYIALIISEKDSKDIFHEKSLNVDLIYRIRNDDSLQKCISEVVIKAEENNIFDFTYYYNLDYFHRMDFDLKTIVKKACDESLDCIIPAFEDKTGIVIKYDDNKLKFLNNDLVHLEKKEIHRKLLLGQGSLTRNLISRKGKLIEEQANIFFNSTNNILHTIRLGSNAHKSLEKYLKKP